MPLSPKAAALAKTRPFAVDPPCEVGPEWWANSPQRTARLRPRYALHLGALAGSATPLPATHAERFQRAANRFGRVEPEAVGDAVLPLLDDETLLVASYDLTHYLPYRCRQGVERHDLDARHVPAFELRLAQVRGGVVPHAAGLRGSPDLGPHARRPQKRLESPTAGLPQQRRRDGRQVRVVGYAAIAFYQPAAEKTAAAASPGHGDSRRASESCSWIWPAKRWWRRPRPTPPPEPDPHAAAGKLAEFRACFVTLTEKGQLRGCIGTIFPRQAFQAVMHSARSAAVGPAFFARQGR